MSVRERIRLNSKPISEDLFAKYFFEVWNSLRMDKDSSNPTPNYFRFLTLMSFHVFLQEKVEVAIYEVGVGGEFDSTNIIENPVVSGIATLGIDHVDTLGKTIDRIAWHKAGIMKTGCPAFTVEQRPQAMEVLEQRAAEKKTELSTVTVKDSLKDIRLTPSEDYQRKNASLAIELARTALQRLGVSAERITADSDEMIEGLEGLKWRGRSEIKTVGKQRWYLDGAHTDDSLDVACHWAGKAMQKRFVV